MSLSLLSAISIVAVELTAPVLKFIPVITIKSPILKAFVAALLFLEFI